MFPSDLPLFFPVRERGSLRPATLPRWQEQRLRDLIDPEQNGKGR